MRENLEFVARIYGLPRPARAAKAMIARLGLEGREEQIAGKLSGGWKQRLALGACTLPNPQLLLLDEPTAGVDPKARRDFWSEIHDLAAGGLTVLVSTHYMDEAERCHEIAYIAFGGVLARGTVSEVIVNSHLTTFTVDTANGENLAPLARELATRAGVDMVAPFGDEPPCFRPRRRGARSGDCILSNAAGAPLAALQRLARGCVHRPDGPKPGTISNEPAGDAGRRRRRGLLAAHRRHAAQGTAAAAPRSRHARHHDVDPAPAAHHVRLCDQHDAARSADGRIAAGIERRRPLHSRGAAQHQILQGHAPVARR